MKTARSPDVRMYIAILRALGKWCKDSDVIRDVLGCVVQIRLDSVHETVFNMAVLNKGMRRERSPAMMPWDFLWTNGLSVVTRVGLCSVWGCEIRWMETSKLLSVNERELRKKRKKDSVRTFEAGGKRKRSDSEELIEPDARNGKYIWCSRPRAKIRYDWLTNGATSIEITDKKRKTLSVDLSLFGCMINKKKS